MSHEIDSLIDEIEINDVIAEETQTRQNAAPPIKGIEFHNDDFRDAPKVTTLPVEDPLIPKLAPYDAQAEATKLVNLLNGANVLVTTPIANYKLRHNRGGRVKFKKIELARVKAAQDKELTEGEQKLIAEFAAYKSDLKLINGEIPMSEAQLKTLMAIAVPYCEESKININSGFAFWGVYGGMQLEKILKILTA